MKRKPTTIDEYLASVTGEKRRALGSLRKTIRKIVPDAEECISYRIPAFRLNGKVIAGFCATGKVAPTSRSAVLRSGRSGLL